MKEIIYILAGAVSLALVKPFYDFLLKIIDNFKNKPTETVTPFVTHPQLATMKTEIYNDVTTIIDKTCEKMASKESVDNLKDSFDEVKKKVEGMSVIMASVDKTLAIFADRQKRREGDCKDD